MKYAGSNFDDFPENQLTKLPAKYKAIWSPVDHNIISTALSVFMSFLQTVFVPAKGLANY